VSETAHEQPPGTPPTDEGRTVYRGDETLIDHISLWVSRITMYLVVAIVLAIAYEVVARYFFRAPTLWANELSLFLGGISYLFAGLFAMQQRGHIRITVVYDIVSERTKRILDVIGTLCVVLFAAGVAIGGFESSWRSLTTWERFGTAWNPPIPAVLKPLVIVVTVLVAIQAVNNLIVDLRSRSQER
jgi:TRAP-type mannitol/chloroaromatic compound transport system permease small subunit